MDPSSYTDEGKTSHAGSLSGPTGVATIRDADTRVERSAPGSIASPAVSSLVSLCEDSEVKNDHKRFIRRRDPRSSSRHNDRFPRSRGTR